MKPPGVVFAIGVLCTSIQADQPIAYPLIDKAMQDSLGVTERHKPDGPRTGQILRSDGEQCSFVQLASPEMKPSYFSTWGDQVNLIVFLEGHGSSLSTNCMTGHPISLALQQRLINDRIVKMYNPKHTFSTEPMLLRGSGQVKGFCIPNQNNEFFAVSVQYFGTVDERNATISSVAHSVAIGPCKEIP